MSAIDGRTLVQPAAVRVPVGRTTIAHRATGAPVDVVVLRNSDDHFHEKPAIGYHLEVGQRRVGYLLINKEQLSYPGRVYIEYMNATEGNEEYRGIGTRMHQIAVEESLNRLGGIHTRFDSEPRAVMFHHHNGYRMPGFNSAAEHEKRLAYMNEEMEDPYGIHKFDTRMILSPEGERTWQERVLERPILFETKTTAAG